MYIRESVDSLCTDDIDTPIVWQGRSHQFVSGPVDGRYIACCVRRNACEARPLGRSGGMSP